ncbi:hypothetical protein A4A49_01026 [Nicotiana attenuata]|uniref:Ubiquitin-like domain-containing protein n=1 Tax=Nicotiana attenuata TaxID=49451 RepID=A0A1J6I6H3_NICAT|nr:hypothetical protein A4A49_01026 [Nicotiana attenuata]
MNLVIEILTGTLFHIQVGKEITVADLKREIGNQENLPENRLILMLNAGGDFFMLNDDEVPLAEHGVKDGSHFYLFFKLPHNNGENQDVGGDNINMNPKTPTSQGDSFPTTNK